jgi:hypothetical protein
MAQGLSIDEQRVGRWSAAVPSSTSVIGTVESEDPNDFAPVSSGAGRGYAYDDDDDDFDDY